MISDNSGEKGDGFEIKSVNGVTTFSIDHNSIGVYNETATTLTGHDDIENRQVLISGNLVFTIGVQDNNTVSIGSGDDLTLYHDGTDSYISKSNWYFEDRYLE